MHTLIKGPRDGIYLAVLLSLFLPLSAQAALEGGKEERALKRVFLYEYGASNNFVSPKENLRKATNKLAEDQGFALTVTRDPKAINYLNLQKFDVVLFAFAQGEFVASVQGQQDLERYIREGGGFITIHSYPGNIRKFTFMTDALGAPGNAWGGMRLKARLYADPQGIGNSDLQEIFKGLPAEVVLQDRWLSFGNNPRKNRDVTVLFSVDESTYPYGHMNGDHPIVWTRTMGKGRVVYNGLGLDNVYTQQNGYGAKLLWNLIEYVAQKTTSEEGLSKTASLNAPVGAVLDGRRVALSLGEGSYSLRVSDFKGRIVLSKTFTGPGQFRTDPIATSGNYTLILTGPSTPIRKQFALK